MNVLFTVGVLLVAAAWLLTVYRRLVGLRDQVKLAWKKLEADQANDAITAVYNKHVKLYNDALEEFPANVVAMLAGLKPARHF
ncbi:MAG: hypothetical protein K2Y23_00605 [Cyanobacteria bacterium]|nr:hypothetical protein [Cyanobacteriota bacterium]